MPGPGRVFGAGTWISWTPSQGSSCGSSVIVVLAPAFTRLQPLIQPWWYLCTADGWCAPLPMNDSEFAYSMCWQFDVLSDSVTPPVQVRLPLTVPPQHIVGSCVMPKLWPISCAYPTIWWNE